MFVWEKSTIAHYCTLHRFIPLILTLPAQKRASDSYGSEFLYANCTRNKQCNKKRRMCKYIETLQYKLWGLFRLSSFCLFVVSRSYTMFGQLKRNFQMNKLSNFTTKINEISSWLTFVNYKWLSHIVAIHSISALFFRSSFSCQAIWLFNYIASKLNKNWVPVAFLKPNKRRIISIQLVSKCHFKHTNKIETKKHIQFSGTFHVRSDKYP